MPPKSPPAIIPIPGQDVIRPASRLVKPLVSSKNRGNHVLKKTIAAALKNCCAHNNHIDVLVTNTIQSILFELSEPVDGEVSFASDVK